MKILHQATTSLMSPLNQKFSCMAGYSEPAALNNNNILLDLPKEDFNKMDQTVRQSKVSTSL